MRSNPGWKGLPGTYTEAYCEHSQITAVKSFITFGPIRWFQRPLKMSAHCSI
jgi:hypothetical protein